MLWFHEGRGSGFLLTEDGERLPIDVEGFADGDAPVGRCAGLPVSFSLAERDGLRIAIDAVFVEAIAPRRARRRGARGGS
jgi:hypothetical protein